jgi:dihydrofolate reductase
MGRLIYSMITSLDGFVSDRDGEFGWGAVGEETHEFINDLTRPVGTYLYGRRMYEVMSYWESVSATRGEPAYIRDFAGIWQAADKIVYSTRLDRVSSERTRIERDFDPEAVRKLKAESDQDLTIDGPTLAAHAIRAGLVDEYQLIIGPALAGGGNRFFPADVAVDLTLLDERRFAGGVVFLRYGTKPAR